MDKRKIVDDIESMTSKTVVVTDETIGDRRLVTVRLDGERIATGPTPLSALKRAKIRVYNHGGDPPSLSRTCRGYSTGKRSTTDRGVKSCGHRLCPSDRCLHRTPEQEAETLRARVLSEVRDVVARHALRPDEIFPVPTVRT